MLLTGSWTHTHWLFRSQLSFKLKFQDCIHNTVENPLKKAEELTEWVKIWKKVFGARTEEQGESRMTVRSLKWHGQPVSLEHLASRRAVRASWWSKETQ